MNLATGMLMNEGIITKFSTNRILCNIIKEIRQSTVKERVLMESSRKTVEIFPKGGREKEWEKVTKAPEKVILCDTLNQL
jgi:hypothetical protein